MSKKNRISVDDRSMMDDDDLEYEKKLAEEEQKRRKAAEAEEAQRQEDAKRRRREKEKAREKRIAEERLELLQLKNGVLDEENATIKEEHTEAVKLTGVKWLGNMWYHYKVLIIFIVCMAAALGYIIYSEVTRERPDLTIMMIANNDLADRSEELELFFEKYTDDLDGNGYVHVAVINMPMNPNNDVQINNAYDTKFVAQVQGGDAMIVITDSNTEFTYRAFLDPELEKVFPGNKYVDELGFSFNSKIMAEELKYANMPNDVHMSIRYPTETMSSSLEESQEKYDKSFTVFKRIVEDVTKRCEETNDPGLETEPIHYDDSTVQ